jgi:acyl-CoA thioester hydrolase
MIRAKLIAFTKVKIVFTYQILRKSDKMLLAEGETTNVFTDLSGKITRLPVEIFDLLSK